MDGLSRSMSFSRTLNCFISIWARGCREWRGPGSQNPAMPPGRGTRPISPSTSSTLGTWWSASLHRMRSTEASSSDILRPSNQVNRIGGRSNSAFSLRAIRSLILRAARDTSDE